MSRHFHYSFFHHQRKRATQRRPRKPLDNQALFGDKKETVLTFRSAGAKERERETSEEDNLPPTTRPLRPPSASSTRREATRKPPVFLPPIDTTGPHLTAPQPQHAAEVTSIGDSVTSERKKKLLKELEEQEPEPQGPQPKYKFNEIKFASTSILSGLARRLEGSPSAVSCDNLPEELVENLRQDFAHLVADTVVEKREWQTDCYVEYKPKNRLPFLTSAPEEGEKVRADLDSSLNWVIREDQKRRAKLLRMQRRKSTPERPHTARSVASIKSDISAGSHEGDRESRADTEYDKLPPELRAQGPPILRYRRETQAPRLNITGPRTRLEKMQGMRAKADQKSKKGVVCLIVCVFT